jgi:hypothetical protein
VDDGVEILKAEPKVGIKYMENDHKQQEYQVDAENITEYTNVLFAKEEPYQARCQQKQTYVYGIESSRYFGPGKQKVEIVGRGQNEQENNKVHRMMLST